MRILYISGAFFPSEVSHTLSIMRMCQAFVDSGHQVLLTGRSSGAYAAKELIEHYGLSGGFAVSLQRIGRLLDNRYTRRFLFLGLWLGLLTRPLFSSFKPDLIYSRLTITELVLVPRSVPIIFEMHSLGPLGQSKLSASVFRWVIKHKNVLRIVVTTEGLAVMIRKTFPHVNVKVARLSSEPPIKVDNDALTLFRERNLQGVNFKHHVGYTGYLDTIGLRGTDLICRVASSMPEVAFHIVGGEQVVVDYWKDYAEHFNQNDNIYFYGYRKPSDMPSFLSCFDLVLAPLQLKVSNSAPTGMNMSPLKLPQYMSYGKAIVASDLLAHREILSDGYDALLVPPSDAHTWTKAINELLKDPVKRASLGKRAKRRYFAEFTPKRRVTDILSGIGLPKV